MLNTINSAPDHDYSSLEDRTVELLLAPGHQGAALYFELIHGFNQSQTHEERPQRAAGKPESEPLRISVSTQPPSLQNSYFRFRTQFFEEGNHMRRFITGAPGSGKTAIIRQLELDGFSIVEEAATDVIAAAQAQGTVQPWTHPSFIDVIANLQRDRQIRASYQPDEVQFHDRCAVCTAALSVYLGHPFSPFLASELQRLQKEAIYQNGVFFIRNLGFITPTEARRISFEETVRFEKIHEETYRDFGFELVSVGPGSVVERVSIIKAAIR